jgi:hypothetical protein
MNLLRIAVAFFFAALSTATTASSTKESFSGRWDWTDAPDLRTFSIDFIQKGKQIVGQYCALSQSGNRTDCDDKRNPNIHGKLDRAGRSALIVFSSFLGGENGKATLKMTEGHLIWQIKKNPTGGEFYAPRDALLSRN